jgi:hypothetical protein
MEKERLAKLSIINYMFNVIKYIIKFFYIKIKKDCFCIFIWYN